MKPRIPLELFPPIATHVPRVEPWYVGKPGGAVEYSPPQYEAGQVGYVGTGAHAFKWGEEKTITVELKAPFCAQKFEAARSGWELLVMGLRVGDKELLRSDTAGVPLFLFSSVSTFPQILWPEMGPEAPVSFRLRAPPDPSPERPSLEWWRRFWLRARVAARAARRGKFVPWLEPRQEPPVFAGCFYGHKGPAVPPFSAAPFEGYKPR